MVEHAIFVYHLNGSFRGCQKQPLVLTQLVMNTRLSSSGSPTSETQVYEPTNTYKFLDMKKPGPLNQTL